MRDLFLRFDQVFFGLEVFQQRLVAVYQQDFVKPEHGLIKAQAVRELFFDFAEISRKLLFFVLKLIDAIAQTL